VTPTYNLHLGAQGATLDVSLDYQITGGRIFELRVDLRGWELSEQPIESGGVVDLVEQHVTEEQMLIMPLKDSDVQQIRLRFALRREAGLGVHDLPMPEAQEASVLPGAFVVTCDEAWRASPQIEKCIGVALAEAPNAANREGAGGRTETSQAAAALRLQTFLPQARLVVDVSERDQVIEVNSIVEANVDGDTLRAEQRLEYEVSYQPAAQLVLTAPTDLLANEGLELLLEGKPLPPSALDIRNLSPAGSADGDQDLRLTLRLPQPLLGRAVLAIRTTTKLESAERAGNARLTIPLATPIQPASTRVTATSSPGGPRVLLWSDGGSDDWKTAEAENSATSTAAPESLELTATKPVRELGLRLQPAVETAPGDVRVVATWAQTWFAGGVRQDRFAFRFSTSGSSIELAMPEEFEMRPLEVVLNGEVLSADHAESGKLRIGLPSSQAVRTHTLELRLQSPQRLRSYSAIAASFPQLVGGRQASPLLWQLVVPSNFSALTTPLGFSPEYEIGWRGWRWGRHPTQSQADLEQWVGATRSLGPPPAAHQYLYSAFQAPPDAEVAVLRHIWVIVAAGLAALAVGLAWMYTRLGRSTAFWLSLSAALAVLLFAYPETVVVVVQAIFLGGVFTLVSAVTRWLMSSEASSHVMAPASSVAHLAATEAWVSDGAESDEAVASAPSFHTSGSAS
jgi:hypothetical protein